MRKAIYTLLLMAALGKVAFGQSQDLVSGEENTVVGAIGGTVNVSGLGGATYTIPIQVPEGLGGIQPNLSVCYNSQGGNGLLGWCWDLQGLSCISRIGTTLYHENKMSGVDFIDDRFALDGQRLLKVQGDMNYGGNEVEYCTEMDGMAKIVSYTMNGIEGPAYFKVWLPNGNIAYYGRSRDSRIVLSQQNAVCIWMLDKVEDRNGNYMTYSYDQGGAHYRLNKISYGGNSEANIGCSYSVRFSYSLRTDQEKSFIGDNTLDQKYLLDSIEIKHGSNELYKYKFDYSAPNFSNGYYYTRLNKIDFSGGGESFNPTLVEWGENDYANTTQNLTKDIRIMGGTISSFSGKIKFTGDFNGDGYTDVLLYHKESKATKKALYYLNKGIIDGKQAFQYNGGITLNDDIDWIYVADINGDGLDDLVLSSRDRTIAGKDKLDIDAFLSQVNEQGSFSFSCADKNFGIIKIKKRYHESILMGDFLGDGKQSILLQAGENDGTDSKLIYITFSSGVFTAIELPLSMLLDVDRMFACDFNGDGISEIYYSNNENNVAITGLKRLRKNHSGYYYEDINSNMLSPWHKLFPGDFNGDGKLDLLSYVEDGEGNGGWYIQYFKESELSWPAFSISNETMGIGNPGEHGYSLKNLSDAAYQFISVGDFNGDGKSDIAVRTSGNKMRFLYAPLRMEDGVAKFASVQNINLNNMGMSGVSNQTICTGNFLGHENMSMFSANTLYSLNPLTKRYSVSSIVDGMGNCNKLDYDYLMPNLSEASDSDFYKRTRQTATEQELNMFTMGIPMKALRNVVSYNCQCPSRITETIYSYENVLVHKRGRGLLGFKKTKVENHLGGTLQQTVEQVFEVCPCFIPYLGLKSTTVKNQRGVLLSETENTNEVLCKFVPNHTSGANSQVFVPVVTKQITDHYSPDYLNPFLKREIVENKYNDTAYNSYGELFFNITYYGYDILKQIEVKCGTDARSSVNSVDSCEFQTITKTDYAEDHINDWVINRPLKVTETARRLGGYDDVSSLTVYQYSPNPNANPFLPFEVTNYPGGTENASDTLATKTTFYYNETGDISEKYHRDLLQNLPLQLSTYKYSPDGRFLRKSINTAGYTTSYEYDGDYGFLETETDCNGLVTSYFTTPLGTTSSVLHPDGTVAESGTAWVEQGDPKAPEWAMYYTWSKATGKGETRTYFDAAGAKLRSVAPGMDMTELIYKDFYYDEKGRLMIETLPYFGNDPNSQIHSKKYEYDDYNRLVHINHPHELLETYSYNGLETRHIFWADYDFPSVTTTITNVAGWTVESIDEWGNAVRYDHYADGSLKWAQIGDDSSTRIKIVYDNAGNRVLLIDPNYGETASRYNAYGQIVWTKTPKGNHTDYRYDPLGRMTKRYEHDVEANKTDSTVWTYFELPGQLGLLEHVSFNGKHQHIVYNYDSLNRVSRVSEMRLCSYYNTSYTYDSASRVASTTYPTGFTMHKQYTPTGHLSTLTDNGGNLLWKTLRKNAFGQVEQYKTGDGLVTRRSHEPKTGRLSRILTMRRNETLQNLSYEYDKIANLAARKDEVHGMEEHFTYDRLNRLTGIIEGADTTGVFTYDAYGRMTSKKIHGEMVFDDATFNAGGRPHAIAEAQAYGDLPRHHMQYTHFDKLLCITQDTMRLSYGYGYEHQRLHMEELDAQGDLLRQKDYVGNCEFVTDMNGTTAVTYLSGPLGVFGVHAQRAGYRPNQYFVHPDHLGSWNLVTNRMGNVVQDVAFDAWGTPFGFTATGTEPATSLLFDRGFTGHEHLNSFCLINMNGRMYDPFTSSFLSVDNYVQSPDYTQSFNRYAYCLNNPLKYTDPDGEFWHIVIGAAIGGIANLTSGLLSGKIDTFGEGLAYFGIGAAAGALSAGVGAGVSSLIGGGAFSAGFLGTTAAKTAVTSFASGAVIGGSSGLTGGFITGAGNSWMQGANFGQGLWAGLKSGGKGAFWGAIGGGLAGGIDAALHGRDFWSGDVVTTVNRKYPTGPDYTQPSGSQDCGPTTGKAIDNYHGGKRTAREIRDLCWKKGSSVNEGVPDQVFWKKFADLEGMSYEFTNEVSKSDIFNAFSNGADVPLTVSDNGFHAVLLTEMEQRTHVQWFSGISKTTYRGFVFDPRIGSVDYGNYFDFRKVGSVFFLRK